MSTTASGYGDRFPKLLLVCPTSAAEPRLLRALHRAGVAAKDTDRHGDGQKLFGTRIVADPADEWAELERWVHAVVAFGATAWAASLDVLSLDGPEFTHGASVTTAGSRPVTVLGCVDLGDETPTDAALAEILSAAQQAAGLTWGCGGKV